MATSGHDSGEASPLDEICDDLSRLYDELFPARSTWCNIGLKLKVDMDTLNAIASTNLKKPDDCLRETLAKRLGAVSPLSWREVCSCLRSQTVDRNDLAENIEKWRKGIATQVLSLSSPPVTGILNDSSVNQTNQEVAMSTRGDISPREDTISLTLTIKSCSTMKEKVVKLEKVFNELARKAFEHFDSHSIKLRTFKGKISCMDVSLRASVFDHLKACFSDLEPQSEIADAWMQLSSLWDFLNYELLEHVIETFIPDSNLKLDLKRYVEAIDSFNSSTTVLEFYQAWPFCMKKPKEAKVQEMVAKTERSWEQCSLQDIKETTNSLAQQFSLPRPFLLMRDVKEGCVSILWYIPPSVAALLKSLEVKSTSDNGFLSITIDGVQVYPLTPMRQASLQLMRMYTSRQSTKESQNLLQQYKLALITRIPLQNDDNYTKGTLRGDKDDICYKKSPTTVSTLGHLSDGSPARLVVVEGAPGVGKTTFSLEACIKWANKELLKDNAILFLLPLRDFNIQNINNLDELVTLINAGDKSLVEQLEANKGEGTAFWLDGWDEIASTLDGQSCFFEKIVCGEILPKARVIVTSRPWAIGYIKKRQPTQHIEIVASVQDQIDWLIEQKKQSPPKTTTLLDQFLKYLDDAPAIKGYMHTPLATSITLSVFQWCRESSSALPTTVTQLYTAYTCFCIHGHLDKHPHFEPKWKSNNFSSLSQPLKSFFYSLSQLGLHGLLENVPRLVFPNLPDHLRLETLGLMQTVDPLYTSEKSAVVSYHFNHLTLQEYIAAFSLSQMRDVEKSAIIQRCVNDGHFTEVLRFLSGLTKSFRVLIKRMIDSGQTKNKLTAFHWLFEGGDKDSIAHILGEGEVHIQSKYSWSALDFFVTGYCIARSNCAWNISFSDSHMGDEKMTQFLQALSNVDGEQGNASITSLHCSCNDLTSQSLRYLQDIPAHFLRHLRNLNVSNNKLDGSTVDHITNTIHYMPQLETLILRGNRTIKRGGTVSLVSALCDHKSLKKLNFDATNIAEEDCVQLARLLCCCQSLQSLDVTSNSLSFESVQILFGGLHQNSYLKTLDMSCNSISLDAMTTLSSYLGDQHKCKLEKLCLCNCKISPESTIELAHGLSRNCSVKELDFFWNLPGDSGVIALGRALETNKTLTVLSLYDCSITTVGGAALASSLMANSTIETLDIGSNLLGGEAIQKFAELIQNNKTLRKLHISRDDSLTQSDIDTLLNSNQTLEKLTLPSH